MFSQIVARKRSVSCRTKLIWSRRDLKSSFKALRPAVVHTRNLAALEAVVPGWAAGVPVRIHGEHGWDISDPDGASRKHRLVRRLRPATA
jgi:hypothetical protein